MAMKTCLVKKFGLIFKKKLILQKLSVPIIKMFKNFDVHNCIAVRFIKFAPNGYGY